MTYVFGYGTLRDDLGSYSKVPRFLKPLGSTILRRAELWVVRNNWGEWAGVVKSNAGSVVKGTLFVAQWPKYVNVKVIGEWFDTPGEFALAKLDRREGCWFGKEKASCYHRELVNVEFDGKVYQTWVYFSAGRNKLIRKVRSGDWEETLYGSHHVTK